MIAILQGKLYMFDKVFKPNASQDKVYNEAAKSIVKGILVGDCLILFIIYTQFFYKMFSWAIMEPYLLMVKHPPEKLTPWRE